MSDGSSDYEPFRNRRNASPGTSRYHSPTSTTAFATRRTSPRKTVAASYELVIPNDFEEEHGVVRAPNLLSRSKTTQSSTGGQIRLAPLKTVAAQRNGLSIGCQTVFHDAMTATRSTTGLSQRVKSCPAKTLPKLPFDLKAGRMEESTEENITCCSETDDSSSDDDLPSVKSFINRPQRQLFPGRDPDKSLDLELSQTLNRLGTLRPGSVLDSPPSESKRGITQTTRDTSSDHEVWKDAVVRFSPPQSVVHKSEDLQERPCTPPPRSPTRPRLVSPSKMATKIPTPPLRQSLDDFWNAETVNDWNEHYSPQKVVQSPKKSRFVHIDYLDSPNTSPGKHQSPQKRTRAEILTRKGFDARKKQLAEDFFAEIDRRMTNGEIQSLAASTGGVRIVWSKTLKSTAGRANWRKETVKSGKADGTVSVECRHYTSVELAEKVIDDEHRLLNVLAHEFCHLANFMISGIRDRPHGAEFKAWGRKCTAAFADRGIEVTTKHSYKIEYKYIWACSNEDCGAEYKRHSKSIDLKRHNCGACRSKLVQIQPAPRKGANGGQANGYAAYVKQHFASVRRDMPGASQKEVMEAVGRKYRAEKEDPSQTTDPQAVQDADLTKGPPGLLDIVRGLEVVTLED